MSLDLTISFKQTPQVLFEDPLAKPSDVGFSRIETWKLRLGNCGFEFLGEQCRGISRAETEERKTKASRAYAP